MKYRLIIDSNAEEEIIVRVHAKSRLTEQIENLVNSYISGQGIAVTDDGTIFILAFSDIECITVIDRKVYAIDRDGKKYRVNQRLCDLEEMLPSYFIRINKSSIANEERIARFHTVYSGAVDAIFKCGFREYVSRRCFSEIKRRLIRK